MAPISTFRHHHHQDSMAATRIGDDSLTILEARDELEVRLFNEFLVSIKSPFFSVHAFRFRVSFWRNSKNYFENALNRDIILFPTGL